MQKVDYPYLVVTLKTQVFTVTTNAQNTVQHFQEGFISALKTFHFFRRGACVCRRGGGLLAAAGTTFKNNKQTKQLFIVDYAETNKTIELLRLKVF